MDADLLLSRPRVAPRAHNRAGAVPGPASAWLTSVLREEVGFQDLVVSDWRAVYRRVPALLSGLDLEMPPALGRNPETIVAVGAGEVPLTVLHAPVRTVLTITPSGSGCWASPSEPICGHAMAGETPATQATAIEAERRDRSTDVIR
jgi:hypothetical protein